MNQNFLPPQCKKKARGRRVENYVIYLQLRDKEILQRQTAYISPDLH